MIGRLQFVVAILIIGFSCCFADPDPYSSGKYDPNKYNTGRYIPSSEGKYVHKTYPYVHVHDSRELGQYHHIHIPYDGGYGPYNGTNIPYVHDANGVYSHDQYTVSNTLDISPESYDIPIPEISLEYGFPDHTPVSAKPAVAIAPSIAEQSLANEESVRILGRSIPEQILAGENPAVLPVDSIPERILESDKPAVLSVDTTTEQIFEGENPEVLPVNTISDPTPQSVKSEITIERDPSDPAPEKRAKRSIATNAQQQSILAILPIHYFITNNAEADQHAAVQHSHEASQILIDSQTTTTTTQRPRVRYDDQGRFRIIRQEEVKKHHKYDFLYLTENGIYAEEQAKLRDEQNRATGTNSKGYYEYTGDDGKLYRVQYTVGEQGFVPEGEHIPTTPPVPIAIQRALDYVAAQKRSSALKL